MLGILTINQSMLWQYFSLTETKNDGIFEKDYDNSKNWEDSNQKPRTLRRILTEITRPNAPHPTPGSALLSGMRVFFMHGFALDYTRIFYNCLPTYFKIPPDHSFLQSGGIHAFPALFPCFCDVAAASAGRRDSLQISKSHWQSHLAFVGYQIRPGSAQ